MPTAPALYALRNAGHPQACNQVYAAPLNTMTANMHGHGANSMEYEGQIKISVHGTTQWVWVDIKAQSVEFARALLQAQYGRPNVLTVQQKRKR
jgi:hypothetical protein